MEIVQLAGKVHRRAVGQVSAVGKAHGQHRVAGLQQRHVRRQIGRRAAVGLDIHMVVGGKDLLPLGDAVLLQLVHHMAAAVVAALIAHGPVGGIALGILVGQAAAHRPQYIAAGKILAGDELHRRLLPQLLLRDEVKNMGCHTHLSLPRCGSLHNIIHHLVVSATRKLRHGRWHENAYGMCRFFRKNAETRKKG